MKKNKENTEKIKRIVLKEREKYIGGIATDIYGRKFVMVGIKPEKVQCFSVEELLKLKDLEGFLKNFISEDKMEATLNEIENIRTEISRSYL